MIKNTDDKNKRRTETTQISKKNIFLMFGIGIFMCIFLVGTISAYEFDNKLSYSNNDLKVDFINAFGLGENLGSVELKSHKSVNEVLKVGMGNQVTMFYDFNFNEIYENGLGEVTFINMRTGKEVERNYKFVYLLSEEYESPVYSCSDVLNKNGTIENKCVQTGTGTKTRNKWLSYNSKDIPKGDIRIGIEVEVLKDDYIDGIWEIVGKEVNKHAEWTEELLTDIEAYWQMEDTDVEDATGNGHDGTNNGASFSAGKIGNAGDFVVGESDYVTIGNNILGGESAFTISGWIATDNRTAGTVFRDYQNDIVIKFSADGGTSLQFATTTNNGYVELNSNGNNISLGEWSFFTCVYNGSYMKTYVNGSLINQVAQTGAITSVAGTTSMGAYGGSSQFYDGSIDEVGMWSRALSDEEILILWNDGLGVTYSEEFDYAPSVTLNSPSNNSNISTSEVTFNCTASDDIGLINVSLYLNGVVNETNSSGTNNSNYIFSRTLTDGEYNWTCSATDNESQTTTASYRSFTIDTINPFINISYPTGTLSYKQLNTNETLNVTITDANLDTCWYNYNGTNITFSCATGVLDTNYFNLTTASNSQSITVYANDSFGNLNSTTKSWSYKVLETGRNFSDEAIELSQETFILNISYDSSSWTSLTGTLNYDSTNYTTTLLGSGDTRAFTRTLSIPSISADENKTFYWIIRLTNSTGEYYYNTDTSNQSVINIGIDNCSAYTTTLYNLTLKDEQTQNLLNGDIEIELTITGVNGNDDEIDFSTSFTNVSNCAICLDTNLSSQNLYLDTTIKYSATGYQTEYYNIQNYILNSSSKTQNITLYDLNSTSATIFDILYKGSDFIAVADAIIIITKKYVSEGVFKAVEIPLTDIDGKTTASLEKDSGIYTFNVYKEGEFLSIFSNVIPTCQNDLTGECQINLNAVSSPESVDDFTTQDDLNYQVTWDEDTKIIEFTYSTSTGESSNLNLLVQELNQYENDTICDNSVSASSGTLSCTVPYSYTNQTIIVKLYKDNTFISHYTISIEQNPFDYFGYTGYFLALIIIITIPLMFVTSLIGVVIGMMIGVIMLSLLFLSNGASIYSLTGGVMWFLIASAILIWKLNSTERR